LRNVRIFDQGGQTEQEQLGIERLRRVKELRGHAIHVVNLLILTCSKSRIASRPIHQLKGK
jgi:hypothetical protein